MQIAEIFKSRTWKLFSPHFVGWLCYKLLHSWSQQGCYLQITAGLFLSSKNSAGSVQILTLCNLPWLRAEVNWASLPYHNRTWVWLFCFGQERSTVGRPRRRTSTLVTESVPSQLSGLWKGAETMGHLVQLSGKKEPWGCWESTSVPQKRAQEDARHSPISRGANRPWPAVDVYLKATFPNRSADVQGVIPAGDSLTNLAKEFQTELRGRSSSTSLSLSVLVRKQFP